MKTSLRNQLVLILLFLVYSTKISAQISPELLSWTDFKGNSDNSSSFYAKTNWRVTYQYTVNFNLDTALLNVNTNYFLKESSWVKLSKSTDKLLNHERGHYKFAKLLSLEFEYEVKNNIFFIADYKSKIDSLFNTLLKKYLGMEINYDRETNHMYNEVAQKKWDTFLDSKIHYFESLPD